MDDFDPSRPDWDKSQEGALPESLAGAFVESRKVASKQMAQLEGLEQLSPEQRLDRMDAIQTEVTSLMNSRGAEFATDEQRFIHSWQREATVAASQLKVFQDPANQVEDRENLVLICRRTLATALYKLGRIPDALALAQPFPELLTHIQFIRDAIDLPDDELTAHSCPRPEAEQDGISIELDRRTNYEDVFSEKHGCLVHVWVCSECGLANASPEIPERQQRFDATMHSTIHALAKGDTPNAKGIVESLKLKQFEAGIVLAKN